MADTDAVVDELEAKIAAARLGETSSHEEAVARLVAQGLDERTASLYASHHRGTFRGDLQDTTAAS